MVVGKNLNYTEFRISNELLKFMGTDSLTFI